MPTTVSLLCGSLRNSRPSPSSSISRTVDACTVSPRKSRRKSLCFSSTVTSTPALASSSPSTIPAGPPPTTAQVVRSIADPSSFQRSLNKLRVLLLGVPRQGVVTRLALFVFRPSPPEREGLPASRPVVPASVSRREVVTAALPTSAGSDLHRLHGHGPTARTVAGHRDRGRLRALGRSP